MLFSQSWFFEESRVNFTCDELQFIYRLTSGMFSDHIKTQRTSSPAWKPPWGDRRGVTGTPSPFGGAVQRQSFKPKGGPRADQHGASEARTHRERWGGSRAAAGAGVRAEAGWAGAALPSGELAKYQIWDLVLCRSLFLVLGGHLTLLWGGEARGNQLLRICYVKKPADKISAILPWSHHVNAEVPGRRIWITCTKRSRCVCSHWTTFCLFLWEGKVCLNIFEHDVLAEGFVF